MCYNLGTTNKGFSMASTALFPTPITYLNRKQLRAQCRFKQLAYTALTTQAELVALINA